MIRLRKHRSTPTDTVAAVDLGSNSFHMIVARPNDTELVVVDRLREMVRLAAGLDGHRRLDEAAQRRALGCLERFGQRLREMPPGSVRAVGTNTLRSARNAGGFLEAAEQALGHPIELISGVEEARLIYLGVAQSTPGNTGPRLVMDIGGGSTELIIGEGFEPRRMESLYMGCVSMSQRHFPDGTISAKRWQRALLAARQELEPLETGYRHLGWEEAIGASGTIRAVRSVVQAAGWSATGISREALERLADALLKAGHVDKLKLAGLSAERAPVFPGGLAVLLATFQSLGLEQMRVSDGALREGLLYDLLGRIRHEDVRNRSVESLAARYHVDTEQGVRVARTAAYALEQAAAAWDLEGDESTRWLGWAAQLHEIGLDIAHSQYHKHGAYILENADLAGFSRQEQRVLAALVRLHRRRFAADVLADLPDDWRQPVTYLAILLRLSVVLHRSRSTAALPAFELAASEKALRLRFPDGWLDEHPLTRADLEQEAGYLKASRVKLEFD